MTTLHIFNQGTLQSALLQRCIETMSHKDALIFIEDGVVWATDSPLTSQLLGKAPQNAGIYVLSEDLGARGLSELKAESVAVVDYNGFVELTEQSQNTLSWF
ncbi:hypothetical protein BTA51_07310 [Hahella sp. CCB-MM4]|uniref:sulfurtransferase complex subunit TusB n=1 Tax=Hahella sp. (strain CCB-MM4) TaxID=1926491 RepID=UPI000B9C518C|nr:sulfurtransferase complex subunit TusB [Hahella sp. CCB-MM4]OZG73622.1 hypothetical protein BTA51_07310 [Hahella sp. CCB-MM4]